MSEVFRLQPAGSGPQKPIRGRSEIAFPYYDLRQSERLANQVWSNAGKCTPEQLAAWLGHRTLYSGAFRNRVSSAAQFGLVVSSRKLIALTDLGRQITNPPQAREARVRAFLSVSLYRRIYEDHKGRRLSPAMLLRQQMIELGVTPSQAQTARQVFMRSAEHAGFLEVGDDRLVEPRQSELGAGPGEPDRAEEHGERPARRRYPALIEAVLDQAPWQGEWSEEDFRDWSDLLLRALRMHFRPGTAPDRRD